VPIDAPLAVRQFAVIQAPAGLGLRAVGVEGLGEALLGHGLMQMLGAGSLTTVAPPPASGIRDPVSGVLNGPEIAEYTACRVHAAGPARGRDSRGDACIQCLGQAVPQQSVAEPLHSGGPQAEPRGRLNDGKAQSRSRRRSSAAPAA